MASRGDLSAECLKGRHRSPLYRFERTTGTIIVRLVAYSSHCIDTGFAQQSRALPAEPIARAPSRFRRTAVRHAGRPAADGDQCQLEIKLDGYRTAARLEGGGVRMLTRSGLDWTARFRPNRGSPDGAACPHGLSRRRDRRTHRRGHLRPLPFEAAGTRSRQAYGLTRRVSGNCSVEGVKIGDEF